MTQSTQTQQPARNVSASPMKKPRMTATTSVLLLACPFCGDAPIMEPWHGGGPQKRMISCVSDSCYVGPQVTGSTSRVAAKKWNKRA